MNRPSQGKKMDRKFQSFQSRQQALSRDKLALDPQHVIHFHGEMLINDTELPIIRTDAARAEISIDWCSFFTGFFSDARLYQKNIRKEWSKRTPNGSCWDSWDPARVKQPENPWHASFHHMLKYTFLFSTIQRVRHECVMLGFLGTEVLDLTQAVSLLESYSDMNLAARVSSRRKRMKQHINRVGWKDGVEQYFRREQCAIEILDPEREYRYLRPLLPECGAQKWVTLRYGYQPELAEKRASCEDENTARMGPPVHTGDEDIRRPR